MPIDWSPLWLSLRYAGLATLLAICMGLPLAWILAHRRFPACELLDAAANLPLVLPPAVLLYYMLAGAQRFSWHAAVAVSAVYTLPLFFRMTRSGLAAVDHSFEDAARGLGAGEWRTFWRVTLPLSWRALLAAILAGFARAFVDFAATAFLAIHPGAGGWALVPLVAAIALAALYIGNRLSRGQVLA